MRSWAQAISLRSAPIKRAALSVVAAEVVQTVVSSPCRRLSTPMFWVPCRHDFFNKRKSLFFPAFFILSTIIVLECNALSLIHGGDARGQLTTLLLTSRMPSRNSGRKNPKAAPCRWPCPQDFNLLWLIAGDVIPLVTPETTATR